MALLLQLALFVVTSQLLFTSDSESEASAKTYVSTSDGASFSVSIFCAEHANRDTTNILDMLEHCYKLMMQMRSFEYAFVFRFQLVRECVACIVNHYWIEELEIPTEMRLFARVIYESRDPSRSSSNGKHRGYLFRQSVTWTMFEHVTQIMVTTNQPLVVRALSHFSTWAIPRGLFTTSQVSAVYHRLDELNQTRNLNDPQWIDLYVNLAWISFCKVENGLFVALPSQTFIDITSNLALFASDVQCLTWIAMEATKSRHTSVKPAHRAQFLQSKHVSKCVERLPAEYQQALFQKIADPSRRIDFQQIDFRPISIPGELPVGNHGQHIGIGSKRWLEKRLT